MFELLVNTLPVALLVVPMDINIDPNTSGLPGIDQLRTIVGVVMTIGLILSVLMLIVSAIVWGSERTLPTRIWPAGERSAYSSRARQR